MTMGFSSCSSLFYDAKVDVFEQYQRMSRQESQDVQGSMSPLRARIYREWEYSKLLSGKSNISRTQIVIDF